MDQCHSSLSHTYKIRSEVFRMSLFKNHNFVNYEYIICMKKLLALSRKHDSLMQIYSVSIHTTKINSRVNHLYIIKFLNAWLNFFNFSSAWIRVMSVPPQRFISYRRFLLTLWLMDGKSCLCIYTAKPQTLELLLFKMLIFIFIYLYALDWIKLSQCLYVEALNPPCDCVWK